MDIHFNTRSLNDAGHMKNMWKHMSRTAKKYEGVAFKCVILKELTVPYNENIQHCVFEFLHDGDDAYDKAVFDYAVNFAEKLLRLPGIHALTVVGGQQPEGGYIYPAIHILCDESSISFIELAYEQL